MGKILLRVGVGESLCLGESKQKGKDTLFYVTKWQKCWTWAPGGKKEKIEGKQSRIQERIGERRAGNFWEVGTLGGIRDAQRSNMRFSVVGSVAYDVTPLSDHLVLSKIPYFHGCFWGGKRVTEKELLYRGWCQSRIEEIATRHAAEQILTKSRCENRMNFKTGSIFPRIWRFRRKCFRFP